MPHPRTGCSHANIGGNTAQVVCAIGKCQPNSHVGVCRMCPSNTNPKERREAGRMLREANKANMVKSEAGDCVPCAERTAQREREIAEAKALIVASTA